MARPKRPSKSVMVSSASVHRSGMKRTPLDERNQIAKGWQREAYRHVNICGEARYAVSLFAATASKAEIGVSEPQTLARKAVWVSEGEEVDSFAEIVPDVRARTNLLRSYMLHYIIAGEAYLIARQPVATDPPGSDVVWEVVGVTELRRVSDDWEVRHENGNYLKIPSDYPVIRMWNPDPENRQEAWSPMRSMLPTLREIEWLTKHIFTQIRSRLISAGILFLPDNLTFADPPSDSVPGGEEQIAAMNDAERFMVSLAASSMQMLEADEVAFPTIVMAEAAALPNVDQSKLIQFWSTIDDKAMLLRTDNVRRFALGMDLPPEQILGSSGLAISGSAGSAGSSNHWSIWANEEQTISTHIEPALDIFTGELTAAVLRALVPGTDKVIAYDSATLRLKQDRSKESIELFDRGALSGKVMLRENGFDPETDMMDDAEFKRFLLMRVAGGSASPEQVNEALKHLGIIFSAQVSGNPEQPTGLPGRNEPRSLQEHPYEGPPRVDHEHKPAPYSAQAAAAEVLVLRALEKAGNIVLNAGKRGKDRDRSTPPLLAHVVNDVETTPEFDFSLAATAFGDLPAIQRAEKERQMRTLCQELYETGTPYTRAALLKHLEG